MNNNIPHLLGLSHNHHVGLPSYYSQAVFEGLKKMIGHSKKNKESRSRLV